MNTKQILIVFGVNSSALPWKDLGKNFETTIVTTDERAIEIANRQPFDIAVIDSFAADIDYKKLSAVLPILQSEIELIPYKGEKFDGLANKIKAVCIEKRNQRLKRLLVLDSSTLNHRNTLPFSAN